jgi:hypothetical protein
MPALQNAYEHPCPQYPYWVNARLTDDRDTARDAARDLAHMASHIGALNVHQMLLDEVVAEADSVPDSAKELCLDSPSRKSYAVTDSQASLMMYW